MGNRGSPPPRPPKWQQVIAPLSPPPAAEGEGAGEPKVAMVPEDRLDDPRELAPSFARLPDHAKEDLRNRWRRQEGVHAEQVVRRKDTTHRWVAEGAAIFFVAVALLQMPTRLGLVVAAAVGAGLGAVASRLKPGPLVYGFFFAAVYALFGAFSGFKNLVWGIISIPIVFGVAAALATTHRLQRFDRTEL
jgi:hypothetical protein